RLRNTARHRHDTRGKTYRETIAQARGPSRDPPAHDLASQRGGRHACAHIKVEGNPADQTVEPKPWQKPNRPIERHDRSDVPNCPDAPGSAPCELAKACLRGSVTKALEILRADQPQLRALRKVDLGGRRGGGQNGDAVSRVGHAFYDVERTGIPR